MRFNIPLTVQHVVRLNPGVWLSDECINFYMALLQERDTRLLRGSTSSSARPSLFFSSGFLSLLTQSSGVRHWTRRHDVFGMRRIFIPVHRENSHWAMIVVAIESREIHYYDSLSRDGSNFVRPVLQWLTDETNARGLPALQTELWSLFHREPHVPQQRNFDDCGVFAILFADFQADGLPVSLIAPEDMPQHRRRVVAAFLRPGFPY
jgi:Ulp1 family protease